MGESAAAGLRRVAQSRWLSQGASSRNVSGVGMGPTQKKWGLDPAGASYHGRADQGQGDRSTERSRRPHFFMVWVTGTGNPCRAYRSCTRRAKMPIPEKRSWRIGKTAIMSVEKQSFMNHQPGATSIDFCRKMKICMSMPRFSRVRMRRLQQNASMSCSRLPVTPPPVTFFGDARR